VYELTIEREFCAAHAIVINGEQEQLHGHNWRVRVAVRSEGLDSDGLVCDFHDLERSIDATIGAWNNAYLNDTPPFDHVNPTAEHVAREIARGIAGSLPANVRIHRVSVTEAPGCEAAYLPD